MGVLLRRGWLRLSRRRLRLPRRRLGQAIQQHPLRHERLRCPGLPAPLLQWMARRNGERLGGTRPGFETTGLSGSSACTTTSEDVCTLSSTLRGLHVSGLAKVAPERLCRGAWSARSWCAMCTLSTRSAQCRRDLLPESLVYTVVKGAGASGDPRDLSARRHCEFWYISREPNYHPFLCHALGSLKLQSAPWSMSTRIGVAAAQTRGQRLQQARAWHDDNLSRKTMQCLSVYGPQVALLATLQDRVQRRQCQDRAHSQSGGPSEPHCYNHPHTHQQGVASYDAGDAPPQQVTRHPCWREIAL